jgi:DNA topoisomerase-1
MELLSQPKRARGSREKTPLKELGVHPEDKEPVNVYQGPYGIYVKHGKTNAGLPENESIETITLAKALELLAAKTATKKTAKTGKRKTTKTTKTAKTAKKN